MSSFMDTIVGCQIIPVVLDSESRQFGRCNHDGSRTPIITTTTATQKMEPGKNFKYFAAFSRSETSRDCDFILETDTHYTFSALCFQCNTVILCFQASVSISSWRNTFEMVDKIIKHFKPILTIRDLALGNMAETER